MAHPPRHNGFAIRDFRVKAEMKTDELANRVGISGPHMRNIENEHREPSLLQLHKIAGVLGVRPASLVRDPAFLTGCPDRHVGASA